MCYIAVDIGVKHFAYAVINNKEQSSLDPQGDNDFNKLLSFGCIELNNDKLINDLIVWFNNFENIKTVIIEQQVKNNVKALIIQNIIMTICEMKNVDYYFKLMGENMKMDYKERKKKSIDYVLMYFNKYNLIDLKLKFMRFIKKDDVADALNMGLMYLYGLKSKKIIEVYKGL